MDKVKQMQDQATNGSNDATQIVDIAGPIDGLTGPSSGQCCPGVPSSESGEQDTGIHSQRELEEQIANLLAANEALANEFKLADKRYHDASERNTHLEAKLQEMSEQYQQAAVVIAQQSNQINQLNSELIVYLRQIIGNQDAQLQALSQNAGGESAALGSG